MGAEKKRQRKKLCDREDKRIWETWEKSPKRERLSDEVTQCEEAGAVCDVRSDLPRLGLNQPTGRETRVNRLHSEKNFYFTDFSMYICGHVYIKLKDGTDLWIIIKGWVHERPIMPHSLVLKPV